MSAPMHHLKDIDPALMYAPPHVREHGRNLDDNPGESSFEAPADLHEPCDLDDAPEFSGDPPLPELHRRSTLDPEWIREPPPTAGEHNIWMMTLRVGGFLALATMVAWLVVSTPAIKLFLGSTVIGASFPNIGAREPTEPQPPVQASRMHVAALLHARSQFAAKVGQPPAVEQQSVVRQTRAEATPAVKEQGALPVATFTSVAPTAAAPARETHSPAEAANFVSRHIGPGELDAMLQRAAGFIQSGDLSSARLLLRRAAEAGDVRAAFSLAGTFDPNVLKALGMRDGAPDVPQARLWYERAAQLGSTDASRRLQQLAATSAQ